MSSAVSGARRGGATKPDTMRWGRFVPDGAVPLWHTEGLRRNPLTDPRSRRLPELILGAGLIADAIGVPGIGIPLPEMCGIALVLLAITRAPERSLARFGILGVLASVLVVYLCVGTMANGLDPSRRLTRIVVLILMIWALASERLDIRAVLMGMGLGSLINVPLFYAGLAPDTYGGYLTGLMGDKNVAGMFYALVPVLLCATTTRMKLKVTYLVLGIGLTFLTGSRTSLAALFCAMFWMLLSPYVGRVFRLLLLGGMAWLVDWAERTLADHEIFGDRTGTDWFREQIHEASWAKTQAAPWYGEGLSTAYVDLENVTMFFHNSYWGLLTEGGYFFMLVVVGAYVFIGLRPLAAAVERTPTRVAIEAATVVIFVVSLQIGEAFITIAGAIVLACGLLLMADEINPLSLQDKETQRIERVSAKVRRSAGLQE
ncbi:hypothetical protein ACL90Y_00715 [Micrococcus luteus]